MTNKDPENKPNNKSQSKAQDTTETIQESKSKEEVLRRLSTEKPLKYLQQIAQVIILKELREDYSGVPSIGEALTYWESQSILPTEAIEIILGFNKLFDSNDFYQDVLILFQNLPLTELKNSIEFGEYKNTSYQDFKQDLRNVLRIWLDELEKTAIPSPVVDLLKNIVESKIGPYSSRSKGNDVKPSKNKDKYWNCDIDRKMIEVMKLLYGSSKSSQTTTKDKGAFMQRSKPKTRSTPKIDLTRIQPKKIVNNLDQYVIGQNQTKKIIAVGVYNHYKRILLSKPSFQLQKSNILLIGDTGCGKTLMVKTLSRFLQVPLLVVNITSFTKSGYVGDDPKDMIGRLYDITQDAELTERGIIFIDEFDKIGKPTQSKDRDRGIGDTGLQQSILKMMEGDMVEANKGVHGRYHPPIDTTNILFICGGSFIGIHDIVEKRLLRSQDSYHLKSKQICPDDLIEFGMMPELVGRIPVIAEFSNLTHQDLLSILTKPKDAIIKQYQKMFDMDHCQLTFSNTVLEEIAHLALIRNVGARGLRTIVENLLLNYMYRIAGNTEPMKLHIKDINSVVEEL